jgi:glycosyltransferase involved in cell wall biosynthesis
MTDASSSLSVVLPVYGNEDTLRELCRRLDAALAGELAELLFVVDGSPDGSLELLRDLRRRDDRIRVVDLERNRGQQRAILEGLARARGGRVVVMDADLQDPPEAIPRLLAASDQAAAVFAGRRGRYESRPRLVTSKLFKALNAALCDVPRDAGAFVLLRRDAVDRVLELRGPPPHLTSMIGLTGVTTASVPVERTPTSGSGYTALGRLHAGIGGLAWGLLWRFAPLRRLVARTGS